MNTFYDFLEKKGVFDNIKEGNILDIGSGSGDDAIALEKKGFIVTSIEKNKDRYDLIMEKVHESDSKIEVINIEIENYNFPVDKYNVIVAKNSLPFILQKENQFKVIEKTYSSLTKNGYLYLTLFGPKDAWANNIITGIDFKEAKTFLKKTGFEIKWHAIEEGWSKTTKGELKYWDINKFICKKSH